MLKRLALAAMLTAGLAITVQPSFAGQPSAAPSAAAAKTTAPKKGMVWANPESKIYHVEGSRFYGKTAKGVWMSEAEAKAKGFRAAGAAPAASAKPPAKKAK